MKEQTELRGSAWLISWLLWLLGWFTMLAWLAAIMPLSWMDQVHQWLGLGKLPEGPIVPYLARSTSGLYGLHAVVVLYLSYHLRRFWDFIPALFTAHIVLGLLLLYTGITAPLPAWWTVGEGPGLIGFAVVILVLYYRANRESSAS